MCLILGPGWSRGAADRDVCHSEPPRSVMCVNEVKILGRLSGQAPSSTALGQRVVFREGEQHRSPSSRISHVFILTAAFTSEPNSVLHRRSSTRLSGPQQAAWPAWPGSLLPPPPSDCPAMPTVNRQRPMVNGQRKKNSQHQPLSGASSSKRTGAAAGGRGKRERGQSERGRGGGTRREDMSVTQ
eukprot:2675281-Rhodomonas_salina.8